MNELRGPLPRAVAGATPARLALVASVLLAVAWLPAAGAAARSPTRVLLAACAVVTAAALARAARTTPERIVAIATIVALVVPLARTLPRLARGSISADEAQANVESKWRLYLAEATRLLHAPLPRGSTTELFATLERLAASTPLEGVALSVLSPTGHPIAWAGAALDPRPPLGLSDDALDCRVRQSGDRHVLSLASMDGATRELRTVDVVIAAPSDGQNPTAGSPPPFLAERVTGDRRCGVVFITYPQTERAYAGLFAQRGEPFRTEAGKERFRYFSLRAPDGSIVAVVTLPESAPRRDDRLAAAGHKAAVWMGAALFVWLWFLAISGATGVGPLLGGALCGILAVGAGPSPHQLGPLWIIAGLTTLAVAVRDLARPSRPQAIGAGLAAGALVSQATHLLPAATAFRVAIADDPFSFAAPALTLAPLLGWAVTFSALLLLSARSSPTMATALVSAASALLIGSTAAPARLVPLALVLLVPVVHLVWPRLRYEPARPGHAVRAALLTTLMLAMGAVLAYGCLLESTPARLRRFIEDDLRPRIEDLPLARRRLLGDVLARLGRSAEPAAVAASRGGGDERAYTLWKMSGLAESGTDSAIGLYSDSLDQVGAFARQFPDASVAAWDEDEIAGAGGVVAVETFQRSELRRGLAGQVALPAAAGLPGQVRVVIATDLPSLRFPRTGPWGDVLTAKLTDAGRSIWTSSGAVLQIDAAAAEPWDGQRLLSFDVQGDRYVGVAFLQGQERVLVGLEVPPSVVAISNAVGAAWSGAWIAILLLSCGAALAALDPTRRRGFELRWPGVVPWRRYGVVLLLSLLVATLLPALFIRVGMEPIVHRSFDALLQGEARAAVDAARRTTTELFWEQPSLAGADRKAELVADLVGLDVDVFEGGVMVATSRRQQVNAGALSQLLHPQAYVAIELDDRPLSIFRRDGQAMAASPVALGSPMRRGVLAVPLRARTGTIDDQMLALDATVRVLGSVLFMVSATLALLLARSLSRPLELLTQGAERISRGEYDVPEARGAFVEIATLGGAMGRMAKELARQRHALVERGDYIETILDHAPSGVISIDADGVVRTANRSAVALLQLPVDAVGRARLVDVLRRDRALRSVVDAYVAYEREPRLRTVECSLASAKVRLRVSFIPLETAGAHGTIVMLEDVSDVARANRMAAWAEMARTVAHEIKNPLTPIQLQVEHLARVIRDAEGHVPEHVAGAATAAIRTVLEQVEGLKRIASQFSLLARPQLEPPAPTEIGPLLLRVARGYQRADGAVEVSVVVEPGLPAVSGVAHDLERAFQNIVQNAYEAVTRNPHGTPQHIEIGARLAGSSVVVTIEDDGPGVAAETRARLFEPYFSTKESGSGLGLALARKIFLEHGGELRLDPTERGARFVVELPVS